MVRAAEHPAVTRPFVDQRSAAVAAGVHEGPHRHVGLADDDHLIAGQPLGQAVVRLGHLGGMGGDERNRAENALDLPLGQFGIGEDSRLEDEEIVTLVGGAGSQMLQQLLGQLGWNMAAPLALHDRLRHRSSPHRDYRLISVIEW